MRPRAERADDPAYGARLWSLWAQDLRDRFHGNAARANARWGFLRPPAGSGRLVWVRAGGSRDSVLLAADAVRAVREKRLDVRLAFTFEWEHPDILRRLQGLKKTAVGFGPSDARAAVRRVLQAFAPLGVIHAGRAPGPNLGRALAAGGIHSIALNAPPSVAESVEAAYPADPQQTRAWREEGGADHLAPAAALLTLLTEAQVDPNFKRYVSGAQTKPLWWIQGITVQEAPVLAAFWRRFARADILFAGASVGDAARLVTALRRAGQQVTAMSAWDRQPLPGGAIAVIDEPRWLPAIAAACSAAHLIAADAATFWQALAGGGPVSLADPGLMDHLNVAAGEGEFVLIDDLEGLAAQWRTWEADPIGARRRGDALRRLFWQERRQAGEVANAFLQRVYDW